jgi:hypothetical protein
MILVQDLTNIDQLMVQYILATRVVRWGDDIIVSKALFNNIPKRVSILFIAIIGNETDMIRRRSSL